MIIQNPKISVIIPSYNKVKFIKETLRSILTQDYKNLEVIIQDGVSTDGTLKIIKKYAKKYPEIITWDSNKDKGQLDAINKGMRRAKGDILAYINADDVYEKNAFNSVANAFSENPKALWFVGGSRVIDGNGNEIVKLVTWYKNLLLSLNSNFYLLITNYLMQPSIFITRKAYEKYGPFMGTSNFVTEYELWLKLGKIKMPVVIKKNLSMFRIETSTITKQMSRNLLAEDEKIINRFTKNPLILTLHKLHNLFRIVIGGMV